MKKTLDQRISELENDDSLCEVVVDLENRVARQEEEHAKVHARITERLVALEREAFGGPLQDHETRLARLEKEEEKTDFALKEHSHRLDLQQIRVNGFDGSLLKDRDQIERLETTVQELQRSLAFTQHRAEHLEGALSLIAAHLNAEQGWIPGLMELVALMPARERR